MVEQIYIAGPECFYLNGDKILNAMRRLAEMNDMEVTLPNDIPLNLSQTDLRLNADTIFENCAQSMNRSTAIIADLEFFRGPEVDGGTIYEIGMAYARGIRCYGFTRDKRKMVWKYQNGVLKDGVTYDQKGRELPYSLLPFSPNVIGSTKIVEGDFSDCLKTMMLDIEEEKKATALGIRFPVRALPKRSNNIGSQPVVFLAGPERFEKNAEEIYTRMKAHCTSLGLYPVTPIDRAPGINVVNSDDQVISACQTFRNNCSHVINCDAIVANLNDFHCWEPESDTSFECGMAFQLGKRLFGYKNSILRMRDHIPNLGFENGYRDACGCNVENFDYPCNLMFSSSMPIYEGDFETIIKHVADVLLR